MNKEENHDKHLNAESPAEKEIKPENLAGSPIIQGKNDDGSDADLSSSDEMNHLIQESSEYPLLFSAAAKFYTGMGAVAVLWLYFYFGRAAFAKLGTENNIRASVELACLFTVAVVFVSFLLTRFTRWGREAETVIAQALGQLKIWQVFFMAVFSGVAEELLFRGAMQLSFASVWGDGNAIFVTSFIFGLFHPPLDRRLFYFPYMAMLLGLVLGWSFWHTGNILCPILIHFGINFCNMSVMVISRSNQK